MVFFFVVGVCCMCSCGVLVVFWRCYVYVLGGLLACFCSCGVLVVLWCFLLLQFSGGFRICFVCLLVVFDCFSNVSLGGFLWCSGGVLVVCFCLFVLGGVLVFVLFFSWVSCVFCCGFLIVF